jgi:hypothetical protein
MLHTNKIEHAIFKRVLATKLAAHLFPSQMLPKLPFRIGHRLSQILCGGSCKGICLSLHL